MTYKVTISKPPNDIKIPQPFKSKIIFSPNPTYNIKIP